MGSLAKLVEGHPVAGGALVLPECPAVAGAVLASGGAGQGWLGVNFAVEADGAGAGNRGVEGFAFAAGAEL